jgi:hypothetical protein
MVRLRAAVDICVSTSGSCGFGVSPLVVALASVVVGAILGFLGAYLLGRQQRSWQDRREWLDRERTQARELDDALVKTQLRIQKKASRTTKIVGGPRTASGRRVGFA